MDDFVKEVRVRNDFKEKNYKNLRTREYLIYDGDYERDKDVIDILIGNVRSDAAREALRTADGLADMIIFHSNVRKNAEVMSEPWEM